MSASPAFGGLRRSLPTTDIEGYVGLCRALEVVRFIVDNVGGITGGMKIGSLAECLGLDRIRIAQDGYVYAPTKPGLGHEIDRNVLDNITRRVER